MHLSFSAFALLAFVTTSTFAWSPVFERAPRGCTADNCLRAVTGTQPGQSQSKINRAADCSSYGVKTVTPSTVTVTATVSFTASATSTLTTTTTSSVLSTVSQFTTTTTSTTTQATLSLYTTTTTTAAPQGAGPAKRAPASSSMIPAYASPCTSAARYYSACSCAGYVTASVVTAPTPTFTITVSATSTIVATARSTSVTVVTSVSTVSFTSTSVVPVGSTSTVYVVSTSTTVSSAAASPTICAASYNVDNDGFKFNRIFSGSGVRERTDNPANDDPEDYPPVPVTFPGSMPVCDALQACINNAFYSTFYFTVDFHWLEAQQEWECVEYYDIGSSASDWNVADSNVGVSLGYAFQYHQT